MLPLFRISTPLNYTRAFVHSIIVNPIQRERKKILISLYSILFAGHQQSSYTRMTPFTITFHSMSHVLSEPWLPYVFSSNGQRYDEHK
uniref:Uncharacterized protein n=1 Tax=Rhizophora mucronata TaxID=61149 RepID=A0A2P2Q950_RHIMU